MLLRKAFPDHPGPALPGAGLRPVTSIPSTGPRKRSRTGTSTTATTSTSKIGLDSTWSTRSRPSGTTASASSWTNTGMRNTAIPSGTSTAGRLSDEDYVLIGPQLTPLSTATSSGPSSTTSATTSPSGTSASAGTARPTSPARCDRDRYLEYRPDCDELFRLYKKTTPPPDRMLRAYHLPTMHPMFDRQLGEHAGVLRQRMVCAHRPEKGAQAHGPPWPGHALRGDAERGQAGSRRGLPVNSGK